MKGNVFKPGMHQLVPKTAKLSEKLDYSKIVAKATEIKPQVTQPMKGWGKRCYVLTQATKDAEKATVEFFAELTFNESPADPKEGYVATDVDTFKGVAIVDFAGETNKDGIQPSCGRVMSYDEFVKEYIPDTTTKVILDRLMDAIESNASVNEWVLSSANEAWESREVGKKRLYKVKYN